MFVLSLCFLQFITAHGGTLATRLIKDVCGPCQRPDDSGVLLPFLRFHTSSPMIESPSVLLVRINGIASYSINLALGTVSRTECSAPTPMCLPVCIRALLATVQIVDWNWLQDCVAGRVPAWCLVWTRNSTAVWALRWCVAWHVVWTRNSTSLWALWFHRAIELWDVVCGLRCCYCRCVNSDDAWFRDR